MSCPPSHAVSAEDVVIWTVARTNGSSQPPVLVSTPGKRTAKLVKIQPGRDFGFRSNIPIGDVDYTPEDAKARAVADAQRDVHNAEGRLAVVRRTLALIEAIEIRGALARLDASL